MFGSLFLRNNMAKLHLSVWCHIFIGIPNVEFNQSVPVDGIVNLMIILPLNE
jgi:hypothetical protein